MKKNYKKILRDSAKNINCDMDQLYTVVKKFKDEIKKMNEEMAKL